ncbi:hypothetical protein [Peredibacter starrii]|uniref:HNH domain-containing protein n=1 Tax=Peredibacter starrii TaxID=28202 RepID=A0AAX4HTU6_9BACT|nr:hypothetical protein [Peredibacter starrii]WPU66637.1 hypothetical protein SOO65_07755 [Peredibacter starrii]
MINLKIPNQNVNIDWYLEYIKKEYDRYLWGNSNLWSLINTWTNKNFQKSFEEILVCSHEELLRIKNAWDSNKKSVPDYIVDIKETYLKFAKSRGGIGDSSKKDRITAFEFVGRIEELTCPYCNKTQIENRQNIRARSSQLDHFFDKDKYPFFALSFFNLVPACSSCNLIKHMKSLDASPHCSIDLCDLSNFSFSGVAGDLSSLEILLTVQGSMTVNEKVLDLKGNYSKNKSNLNNLLLKIQENPEDYFKSLDRIFSKREALEIVHDTVLDKNRFYTKPLSKFKYDILKIFHGNDISD